MNMEKLIEKINALYNKSLEEGLTEEEKEEQEKLRKEYIKIVTGNVRVQLQGIKPAHKNNKVKN